MNTELKGIHSQDEIQEKVKELYKLYFKDVLNYVSYNNGQLDDARDLFQDVVMNFLKLLQEGNTSSIQNEKQYLMGMARNMWLGKIKKEKKTVLTEDFSHAEIMADPATGSERESLFELVSTKLAEISKECRQIIYEAFYMKRSNPELAAITGYTEQFIKVKKHRCLQALKKIVMDSPDFKQLQNAF